MGYAHSNIINDLQVSRISSQFISIGMSSFFLQIGN